MMCAANKEGEIFFFGGVGAGLSESILDVSDDMWIFDTRDYKWQQVSRTEPWPSPVLPVLPVAPLPRKPPPPPPEYVVAMPVIDEDLPAPPLPPRVTPPLPPCPPMPPQTWKRVLRG